MLPAIAEVKDEPELLPRRHRRGDLHRRQVLDHLVLERIRIDETDPSPITELELVQVRQIPPRERRVDRIREPRDGMRRAHDEDPARGRPQPRPKTAEEINPHLKPRPRHAARTLRDRVLSRLLRPARRQALPLGGPRACRPGGWATTA